MLLVIVHEPEVGDVNYIIGKKLAPFASKDFLHFVDDDAEDRDRLG